MSDAPLIWRDIATAPRDGTVILVRAPFDPADVLTHSVVAAASWAPDDPDDKTGHGEGGWIGDIWPEVSEQIGDPSALYPVSGVSISPTHWTDLHELPESWD